MQRSVAGPQRPGAAVCARRPLARSGEAGASVQVCTEPGLSVESSTHSHPLLSCSRLKGRLMSESALTEVLVSIQEAGPEHRHLAAVVLGDKDLVLIPAPPPEVLDPDHEFQVVTIPQPLASGYPVERLWAQCVNVLWNQ